LGRLVMANCWARRAVTLWLDCTSCTKRGEVYENAASCGQESVIGIRARGAAYEPRHKGDGS
jgi:hypothetical protein